MDDPPSVQDCHDIGIVPDREASRPVTQEDEQENRKRGGSGEERKIRPSSISFPARASPATPSGKQEKRKAGKGRFLKEDLSASFTFFLLSRNSCFPHESAKANGLRIKIRSARDNSQKQ